MFNDKVRKEESVLVPAKMPEHETVCERDERSQEMRHENDVPRMATTGDLGPTHTPIK